MSFSYVGLLLPGIPLLLSLAVLAAVPPILPGYMQSPSAALYVFVLYLSIQAVESYLITPLIQQREVLLPSVLTDISAVFRQSLHLFPRVFQGFILGGCWSFSMFSD